MARNNFIVITIVLLYLRHLVVQPSSPPQFKCLFVRCVVVVVVTGNCTYTNISNQIITENCSGRTPPGFQIGNGNNHVCELLYLSMWSSTGFCNTARREQQRTHATQRQHTQRTLETGAEISDRGGQSSAGSEAGAT